MTIYSSGDWLVKEGQEGLFGKAWEEFVRSGDLSQLAGPVLLLQDTENPRHFRSFGLWANAESVRRWRDSPEFESHMVRLRVMLEEVDTELFEVAVMIEPET
ncbi:MAG: antibiotic biosynthesis monooxygenase family protein [Coriobacteriia bacterium]